MRVVILSLFIITSNFVLGQTPVYESYLNSDALVDTIFCDHEKIPMSILTARRKVEYSDILVWLKSPNSKIKPEFLGYIESETGFYLPKKQPLKDYFLIVQVSEFNGTLLLMDNERTIEVPGYYYSISNNRIFTRASGDGEQVVAQYDLESGKLTTKIWDNINGADPWNIESDYNHEDIKWINMR